MPQRLPRPQILRAITFGVVGALGLLVLGVFVLGNNKRDGASDAVPSAPAPSGQAAARNTAPSNTAPSAVASAAANASASGTSAVNGARAPSAPAAAAPVAPTEQAPPTPEELASFTRCSEARALAMKEPALAGAPSYEAARLQFARVRGRALLWRRVPGELSDVIKTRLKKNKPLEAVRGLLRREKSLKERRLALLREGYLWADDVPLALALVEQLGLRALFDEKTLFVQRGVETLELERAHRTRYFPERYRYKDGHYQGMTAELLLGDRVATTREELTKEPLAIDLRDLMDRAGFDRIKVTHLTEKHLVAELRYGPDVWVPALIEHEGPRATVACESLDNDLFAKKRAFVAERALLRTAMGRVREVVRDMVIEELPFDAAADQKNGFLRKAWKRAYLTGWKRFNYEGKSHWVYTRDGKARPPQVCIDFLTDVWERASGTWYAPAAFDPEKDKDWHFEPHPERTKGGIDLDALNIDNRRSVAEFTKFARQHEELFDVWELPADERIRFREREKFFEYLRDKADLLQPGDMVSIHGTKAGGRPHYHSLIMLELDPITGVPTLVGGNAVKAREQTIEGVMQISPQRTWRHRFRVKRPWLAAVAAAANP